MSTQITNQSERVRIAGEVLQRMQSGESLRNIAKDYPVSHVSLRAWTLSELPDQYKDVQQQALITRIVQADDNLDQATDDLRQALDDEVDSERFSRIAELARLNIARGREVAKFARWDAERRLPHLYGAKQEIRHTGDADKPLFVVVRPQGRTIDHASDAPPVDIPDAG